MPPHFCGGIIRLVNLKGWNSNQIMADLQKINVLREML